MNGKKIKVLKHIRKLMLEKYHKYVSMKLLADVYKNLTPVQKAEIKKSNIDRIAELINQKT